MDIQFSAEIKDFKVVYSVLKSIIFKEFVVFRPLEEGLKITVEEMKCVETSVYIPSNLFSSYVIKSTNEIVFKISHKVFIESIHIFGDDGNPSMKMSYKGPGSPLYLVLKHCEENIIVDCEIKTINVEDEFPEVNLADECNVNKVVLNAGKFVEVLSNIDHNSDEFELFLSPEPPYFKITTYGVLGDTQIIIPKNPDIVLIFNCPSESVSKYLFNNIRQILKVLNYANKISISTGNTGLLGFQLVIYADEQKVMYVEYYVTPQFMDE